VGLLLRGREGRFGNGKGRREWKGADEREWARRKGRSHNPPIFGRSIRVPIEEAARGKGYEGAGKRGMKAGIG